MPEKVICKPPLEPPLGPTFGKDACGAATPDGSALNQFAQHLFGAAALPGVLLVTNCSRLAAQFDAQESVFERVEVGVHFLLDISGEWNRWCKRRRRFWRRCRCWRAWLWLGRALRLGPSWSRGWRRRRGIRNRQNGLTDQQCHAHGKNRSEASEQYPFVIVETRRRGLGSRTSARLGAGVSSVHLIGGP